MDDIKRMSDTVFETVEFNFEGKIKTVKKSGVYVKYDGNTAFIGNESKSAFCRGCFLLAKEIKNGKKEFEIQQSAAFEKCGVMIDASRNAVMTVESVKKYINNMATLGFNLLMLYTEDTYEIKEYPYFGYMRGRYSESELKEIDSYAASMGIEVIPCIQTLSHLSQYLKYQITASYRDTGDTLLVDEEETYNFIESAIKSVRRSFKSKQIHIGMDEAGTVGLGKYLIKNGYEPRENLITRHLKRVTEICRKYDFEPMIWSDMYFKLFSKDEKYYSGNAEFTDEVLNGIPDVDMVYWDYYNRDKEVYRRMLKAHKNMKKNVVFAGGLGSWYGFLPWFEDVWEASNAALLVCKEEGIKTVFATLWGDDGNETNAEYSCALLPIFSEHCYTDASEKDIAETSEFLTKIPFEVTKILNSIEPLEGAQIRLKEWIYADILYDYGKSAQRCIHLPELYDEREKLLCEYAEKYGDKRDYYTYAALIFGIAKVKAQLRLDLRKNYQAGNKEYLKNVAEVILPQLTDMYQKLYKIHKKQWANMYKPFGWEILSNRYGGIFNRVSEAQEKILLFITGQICEIPELEEIALNIDSTTAAVRIASPSLMI